MTRTAAYGSNRYLASLKWDGVTPDRNGLFEIPRNINTRIVQHLEALCAKDDRFDWRYIEDAA
jgi:hypothetical protein